MSPLSDTPVLRESSGEKGESIVRNLGIQDSVHHIMIYNDHPEIARILHGMEEKYGKVQHSTLLTGGVTNSVYQISTEKGEFVMKVGAGLEREKAFFEAAKDISLVPKMYDFFDLGEKQCIIMEHKVGVNGKDVFDTIHNWEHIGEQMGSALRQLHNNKSFEKNEQNSAASIDTVINYLSWGNTPEDLAKLRKLLEEKDLDIVNLHGDFSPHNCLFREIQSGEYEVSAIFDPSGRISTGPAIFDVFYALNGRWVKDKEQFKTGFLRGYGDIDLESEEYQLLSKVFGQYLHTLYAWMDAHKN